MPLHACWCPGAADETRTILATGRVRLSHNEVTFGAFGCRQRRPSRITRLNIGPLTEHQQFLTKKKKAFN